MMVRYQVNGFTRGMTFLQRLTDRFVLQPTTDPIDTGNRERMLYSVNDFPLEIWKSSTNGNSASPELLVIKFPGTGGRAERAGVHPVDVWPGVTAEVWAVNHRGYGGSHGPASLQNFAQTCDAVWRQVEERYPGLPVLVTGNSLGCMSALYMAARFPVSGLMLRDGFSLAQMIFLRSRYNWWNLRLLAPHIAQQVPIDLDAILNGKRCKMPALFIRSAEDRVIPGEYQIQIYNAFAGPKREFLVVGADHGERIPERLEGAYCESIVWLREQMCQ